nr:hypothetical protein [Caballeronia terrestris]
MQIDEELDWNALRKIREHGNDPELADDPHPRDDAARCDFACGNRQGDVPERLQGRTPEVLRCFFHVLGHTLECRARGCDEVGETAVGLRDDERARIVVERHAAVRKQFAERAVGPIGGNQKNPGRQRRRQQRK